MYKPGDKIGFIHERESVREVLAVRGNRVFWLFSNGMDASSLPLESTFPLPPAGREVEAEWRLPKLGDYYYDEVRNNWNEATHDWSGIGTDPLNVGWRRPVLVPLVKNRVKGLEVSDDGSVWVQFFDSTLRTRLTYLQSHTDDQLSQGCYTNADIALIRAGLHAGVQRYLDSKPADAEAEMRVATMGDEYYSWPIDSGYQCWHTVTFAGEPGERSPHLGRRRWIRKAATRVPAKGDTYHDTSQATVTTMNLTGGTVVPPAPAGYRHLTPPVFRKPKKTESFLCENGEVDQADCDFDWEKYWIIEPLPAPPSTPLPPVHASHRHTTPPTYRPPRKGEWYLGNNTNGAVFLATEDWKSTPTWIVQPVDAPAPITAEVVPPSLPELWLAVWPRLEGDCHQTTHAYRTREEAESHAYGECIIVRIPPTAGAT